MDLSNAQLQAFRSLHYFHERLNIYVKVATAAVKYVAKNTANGEVTLGELIKSSSSSWGSSPIHSLSEAVEAELLLSVASFGVVSAFSALDDFLTGIEADISRAEAAGLSVVRLEACQSDGADDSVEKTYARYNWDRKGVENLLVLLRYFRLIRNCIAHRSSRCSEKLAEFSREESLKRELTPHLPSVMASLPIFETGGLVEFPSEFAITCSDVIRRVAADMNAKYIMLLGEKGFLVNVMNYAKKSDEFWDSGATRNVEAMLNQPLVVYYRVILSDRLDAVASMKKYGLWKEFLCLCEE